jgi:TetR/AcrR family tetracycline transcriptional repressor
MRFDKTRLVEAALELLDQEGIEGLAMRPLAERVGIRAPSLYNHIRDKAELLAMVADAICAEVDPLDPDRPWRREVERMAHRLRAALLRHPDGARVLAATPPTGPHRLRLMEQVLGAFRRAGFSRERTVDAASSLNSYVVGFVLDETQGGEGDPSTLKAQLMALPKDEFPMIVALAGPLIDAPADRRFRFGLTALLDGIEQRG